MTMYTIGGSVDSVTQRGHIGPFKSANGDWYVVVQSPTIDQWRIMKATTDVGSIWTAQDTSNEPAIANGRGSVAAVLDGNVLHIAAISDTYTSGMSTLQDIEYYTFDVSTDAWSVDEAVTSITVTDVTAYYGLGIAVRSDGDVIVVHPKTQRTNMGAKYSQFGYSRREGGTWTADIALNDANENQSERADLVMAPSDEGHILYEVGGSAYGVTLDSANSLSTRVDVTQHSKTRPVTWDDAGTQRIAWFNSATSAAMHASRATEDGSGDIQAGDNTDVPDANGFSTGNNGIAWDSVSSELYVFWAGPSSDLYYDKAAGGGTGSWGTDVELEDALTVNDVWAGFSTNGADGIGVVVRDGTAIKFEFIDLSGNPPINETGRDFTITSTVTVETEDYIMGEDPRDLTTIVSTLDETDAQTMDEAPSDLATIVSTLDATVGLRLTETGLDLATIVSTISLETDNLIFVESGDISIVSTLDETDAQTMDNVPSDADTIVSTITLEGELLILTEAVDLTTIVSTIDGSDNRVLTETGLDVATIVSTLTIETEDLILTEAVDLTTVVSTLDETDAQTMDEDPIDLTTIVSTIDGSDDLVGGIIDETGRDFTITSTLTIETEDLIIGELARDFTINSTLTLEGDVATFVNAEDLTTVVSTLTVETEDYLITEALDLATITSTLTLEGDVQTMSDIDKALDIISTIDETDTCIFDDDPVADLNIVSVIDGFDDIPSPITTTNVLVGRGLHERVMYSEDVEDDQLLRTEGRPRIRGS